MSGIQCQFQLWQEFLEESKSLKEKKKKKKYNWKEQKLQGSITLEQHNKIIDELFIKHSSLSNIVLRNNLKKKQFKSKIKKQINKKTHKKLFFLNFIFDKTTIFLI